MVFDAAGDADHLAGGPFGGRQGDGGGPLTKGRHPLVDVIHLPLGEDDQRIRPVLQNLCGLAKGRQVRPLPVDAETAVRLQDPLADPCPLSEYLPGGHEEKGAAGLVRGVVHDVGVGVARMIGGDQDPLAGLHRRLQRTRLPDFDLHQLLLAVLHPLAERSPQPDPEGMQFWRPPAGGYLLGIAIHDGILNQAASQAQM